MAHHLTLAHSLLMYGCRTADRQAAVGPPPKGGEGRGCIRRGTGESRGTLPLAGASPAPPQPSSAVDRYRGVGDLFYALLASLCDLRHESRSQLACVPSHGDTA